MKASDICMTHFSVVYSQEVYRIPFSLSSGTISEITYAQVEIHAKNRRGDQAVGKGGVLLSDVWSFPDESLSHQEKDEIMRRLLEALGCYLTQIGELLDPLQVAAAVDMRLKKIADEVVLGRKVPCSIPRLCALVCWSALDAAVHDAWSKASGMSAYDMYRAEFLNEDLSAYLGIGWERMYPHPFLAAPLQKIPIQHVIGGLDPLTCGDRESDANPDSFPETLEQWIAKERLHWFKLKIKGIDVSWDLERIVNVYRIAAAALRKQGTRMPVKLSLDPNEACPSPDPMIETMRKLKERFPEIYAAVQYIEQPTSRDLDSYAFTMHELAGIKPVIMDESMDQLGKLEQIDRLGWSGIALKTGRGHSQSLLAYCWGRKQDKYMTMQDLTNPGLAFVHSANMRGRLALSVHALEHNSRQYIPHSGKDEICDYEGLLRIQDGSIDLCDIKNIGLY